MSNSSSPFRDLRFEKLESLKPQERILKTGITLFNKYGVNTIGIDQVIAESNVSKRTFYNYYPSKNDLISAYLDFWEEYRFTNLEKYLSTLKGNDPKSEILILFDALKDWTSQSDFNGCMFTRGLNDFATDDSGLLVEKVNQHFKKSADFINERLAKIVKPGKAKAILSQLLSLIVGTMVVAHITGDNSIATLNKGIAKTLLEG
ncbi:transcriptional regulator, TetR family [Filimonas lacunae]|uniref:Transcriptional regulator, TetR family n=1 Tax=Filimonas lacunae TaxID=477680 RepID=A0A173MFT2_9BACT|nr:TetR/AcrR family transcriptional regulator [Filimonas lacunae]BAV06453.1 transcriptional regulator, TetR family [Filimonas lacunae]SIT27015.1 transcriptional regulator, TetR family [Filimonas lacunae]